MNDVALAKEPVPPVPVNQPALFQRLRWRLLRNSFGAMVQGASVRLVTIVLVSLIIWGCIFVGSGWGFRFIQYQRFPFQDDIVGTLFDLLFLALALMLVFSGGIILYSSLFASPETEFLLGTPAAADQVFAYKFQGAVAFSSWAFVLLGSPIPIAYGLVVGVPWYFYAVLPLFSLGFVLLPGSLGALACLVIVNVVPRRRRQVLWGAGGALAFGVVVWMARAYQAAPIESWTRDAVRNLLSQFAFAQGFLVPSHWMTQGLMAAKRGDLYDMAYRLCLVWANGLFLYLATAWAARRLYRLGYNRVATGGELRRRYGGGWMDRAVTALVRFLDPQVRLLLVKDLRTFRRDPAQWAQILIFTGLLTFYFANTRRFYQEDIGRAYQNGISLLNLTATALLLCAWTGRFVYPMLSLEGRKFWILGLLPLRRERLLWGKFAFSAFGALVVAGFLVVLSDLTLGVPGLVVGLHVLTVAVLTVGLSGLSVGLGASMPNFRETDPSKIAVGFGGTLNLVASLLFLLAVIGLMALPAHLYLAAGESFDWHESAAPRWIAAGVAAGLALGVLAVVVPLRVGARTLRRMEF
jgi:ABC-2 type transport system permease protein